MLRLPPNARDHDPIMEVLTAFVRERAPWNAAAAAADHRPPPDIQAAITVIGRRSRWFGKGEERHLDLREADLRGSDLADAHLEVADLRGVHLRRASMSDAHLEGAYLIAANLEGAYLSDAHLENYFKVPFELDDKG